jgi:flagellar hook-associated protein 2
MGTITSGIGLVSGINTSQIIDQLIALESKPKDLLQTRIDVNTQKKVAFTDLTTRLAGFKVTGQLLQKASTFQASSTTSTNEDVLTATASNGAAVGSYQFQVARLVTSQQAVTAGFTDTNTAKVGAGTLTLEMGGGELDTPTQLASLNGGAGIGRGIFRITDRSGKSTTIDATAAVTLDDVIHKINTSLDISVHASYSKNGIVLTDLTGKTASDLIVQDVGNGTTAKDLGLAGDVAADTLNGGPIATLGVGTGVSTLNDGRGVRSVATGTDFTLTTGDGASFTINLYGKKTLGDIFDTISTLTSGRIKASVNADGNGLQLTDTAGAGTLSVTADPASEAAQDLGLVGSGTNTLVGKAILAGPNTTLLSSLKGGTGIGLGKISIQDRGSASPTTVDLSGANTVQDVIDAINAAGTQITASLNASGNGLQLQDKSAGTGNIIVSDLDSTTAADLGLAGSFDTTRPIVDGGNLQRQWVSENSLLADYNGGKGVAPGQFKITNSAGISTTIDLSTGSPQRLSDVISLINGKNIGVTASINANGDGLLLTDSAGGSGNLAVADLDGTTAKDLNILSDDTTTTSINGSFEKTITTDASDTLDSLVTKINNLGFGASASVLNDGSSTAPYRLALSARSTGRDGRFVFDAGTTALAAHNLVEAQDASVFVGSSDNAQPLLITSHTNQIANVIRGVTIDLHGVSDSPVTLNVTRNTDDLVDQLQTFTDDFNTMVDKMNDLTKFDTDTNQGGLLLGDSTVQSIQQNAYAMLTGVVSGAGRYRVLSDIGITIGDGAKLAFDADKFKAAYATDPDAVQSLFTKADTGFGTVITKTMTKLVDPVDGEITRENKTIDDSSKQFQDRMDQLDAIIQQKRDRLEKQFANMESVLSGLQSQQSALSSFTGVSPPSSSK